MTEPPIAIELNCETGVETVRPLTEQEIAQREADIARAEAERQAKEAADAQAQAEKSALSAWLLSRSDLTDGARAAILRAMGVAETAGSV
jgi:hypothetical protein